MIDYETALVVGATQDQSVYDHAAALRIRREAFEDDFASAVWGCLSDNIRDGQPFTQVELWMRVRSEFANHEDIYRWYSLAKAEITDFSGHEKWAESVASKWVERKKREAVEKFTALMAAGESVNEAAKQLADDITGAEDSVELEEDRINRQRRQIKERIKERILGTGDVIKTGIKEIDNQCGLIQSHEFIVFAARPGIGKSSLARQIMMEHVRAEKRPVMLFSLEMGVDQVIQAMASTNCGVSSWRIEADFEPRQQMLIDETERFAGALGKYFFIRDDVYKIADIEHEIHIAARRHRPSIIIIDYLQLIEPPNHKGMNREQQVAYMSRRLKQLAQQHRVPIMALCQMGREYEKENRKPRLSDLRESGSLEQDADRVWFLHGDRHADLVDGLLPVQLIQEKCRSGSIACLDIGFKRATTHFMFDKPKERTYDQ